jgi:preprotein translocase subunit YajC
MTIPNFSAMLAMAPQAQSGTGTAPDPKAQMMTTIGMMVLMGVMFYFVLIRPQSKRAKEAAKLLKALKAGDKVVTASGIVGIVIAVKERTVSLRSADTKMEILKSAVTEITERGESSES